MSDTTVVTNVGVGGNELVNFTPVSKGGGGGGEYVPFRIYISQLLDSLFCMKLEQKTCVGVIVIASQNNLSLC